MNPEEFPKAYVAGEHESPIYERWEASGAFKPHADASKPAFSIVMPPPNANGNLHMGHAFEHALGDALVRYRRMKGDRVLWVPGADHAGIETQVVFEKKLEKEGRSRFQMERAQFYKEVWDFTQENKANMVAQLRSLGVSPDWSAERFTLDPQVVSQVYATFRRMYQDGLIYRGERIVNYSVKYQTAYSDLEVEYEERRDSLYYLKYGPLVVATVRPETQFGDEAIAVHPEDERYKAYVGTEIEVTFANGVTKKLPVIADDFVKPEFGTGAVKVTPAHDPNDFDMAQRHGLPLTQVIDRRGKLMEIAGEFAGLKSAEARKQVVAKLEEMELIERIDGNYVHSVGLCYKSKQPLEPLVMPQWYVKVGPLAEAAAKAVEAGDVKFHPEGFARIQLDWLRNLRDWNISRQIWWGIPVNEAMPEEQAVAEDEDTFDTWFSSGQWPYAVLRAVQDGRNYYDEFYPTSVMLTGRDLIFAWVTRMLMLGVYVEGKVPFKDVYFHGMVNDAQGKKMSKSKGNVVNPLEMSAKYGTDALRFGLLIGSSAGQDMPLPEEKVIGGRNFANKLWNISRFVMMMLDGRAPGQLPSFEALRSTDPEVDNVLVRLHLAKGDIEGHMDSYRFAQALQSIHEFSWHELADRYIEHAKNQKGEDGRVTDETCAVLFHVLEETLKLAHPFMPFVTEAIWDRLPEREGMLIVAPWPVVE